MEHSSPTLGLPTSCARGFPWGRAQCWPGPAADPGAAPPRQPCPAGSSFCFQACCACTSPDCREYRRRWDETIGLEAWYQSCPFSFAVAPKVEGARSFAARQGISWQFTHIRVRRHHLKIPQRGKLHWILTLLYFRANSRWKRCAVLVLQLLGEVRMDTVGSRAPVGQGHFSAQMAVVWGAAVGQRVCAHPRGCWSCWWWLSSKTGICKPSTCSSPSKGMELLLTKRTARHCPLGRRKLNTSSHLCKPIELCEGFIFSRCTTWGRALEKLIQTLFSPAPLKYSEERELMGSLLGRDYKGKIWQ